MRTFIDWFFLFLSATFEGILIATAIVAVCHGDLKTIILFWAFAVFWGGMDMIFYGRPKIPSERP